jgi:hypothetical protein
MIRACLCITVMAGLSIGLGNCQSTSSPVVGVASGSWLSLYDAAGTELQRINLKGPVAGFALSPDHNKLVIVSPDTEHGGALVAIDLKIGARTKLTGAPFAFDHLNEGETEVYDGPDFSPDGRHLAFAVHGNQPGDGNDAWENSGPIAVLDFDTGKARVLTATNNIDGNGPCSESDPKWSADGKWILFNCDDGAYLTDAQGATLRKLGIEQDDAGASAIGWVGAHCVLYVLTPIKDPTNAQFDFDHQSAKLLELPSLRSIDATRLVTKFNRSKGGLEQASQYAVIRRTELKLAIETAQKQWEIALSKDRYSPQTGAAQLLTGWEPSMIPEACK